MEANRIGVDNANDAVNSPIDPNSREQSESTISITVIEEAKKISEELEDSNDNTLR